MDVKDTDLKKLLVSVAWLLVSKAPRSRAEKKKKECVEFHRAEKTERKEGEIMFVVDRQDV